MTRLLPFHPIYGGRWFLRRATYSTAKVDYIFATPPTNFPILGILFGNIQEIFWEYWDIFGNLFARPTRGQNSLTCKHNPLSLIILYWQMFQQVDSNFCLLLLINMLFYVGCMLIKEKYSWNIFPSKICQVFSVRIGHLDFENILF